MSAGNSGLSQQSRAYSPHYGLLVIEFRVRSPTVREGSVRMDGSSDSSNEPALTFSGIREASSNIFFGEFRIVADDFFVRHSRRQPAEHIRNRNPHPSNRRSSTALARFDRDDVLVVHFGVYSINAPAPHPPRDIFPSLSRAANKECLSPSIPAPAHLSKSDRRIPAGAACSPSD